MIKELYNIEDDKTVELIAWNHIVIDLEPSFRKKVKILQLRGNTRLKSLLELIKSKISTELCNMALKTSVPVAATSTRTDFYRLLKLDNMVDKLTDQVSCLVTAKSRESNQIFCNF